MLDKVYKLGMVEYFMREVINKKGLSPVIASVLLVFLVLILASIVFLWARGFFSEQLEKGGESVDNQCKKIDFNVELAGGYTGGIQVDLDISNLGSVAIHMVNIKEVKGGEAETHPYVLNLGEGASTRLEVTLDNSDVEEIIITPVIIGEVVGGNKNKPFTCVGNVERLIL